MAKFRQITPLIKYNKMAREMSILPTDILRNYRMNLNEIFSIFFNLKNTYRVQSKF